MKKIWTLDGLNHFYPLPEPERYHWSLDDDLNDAGRHDRLPYVRDGVQDELIAIEDDGSLSISSLREDPDDPRVPMEIIRALDGACSARGYDPGLSAGAEFGLGMRAVRVLLGLSQTDMAEQLGISSPYLSPVERGLRMPSLALLIRFCELVDMPVSDVVRLGEAASAKFISDAAEAERERMSQDMRTSPNEKFDAANNGFRFQPRGQES